MLFYDFFGNDSIKRQLADPEFKKRLPHAMIIEGKNGSGKHSLAKAIALSANCSHTPPCLECPICKKLLADESPDFITVGLTEGRASLGVDSVRFVRSDVYITPNDNLFKIYVIESADKLTPEAQNAFLKVLEEPPEYAVFILLCESADSLLVTVRSRARTLKTEVFGSTALKNYLRENYADRSGSDDGIELAAMLSGGTVGGALEYLKPENAARAIEVYRQCLEFVELTVKRSPASKLYAYLYGLGLSREETAVFFERLALAFRDGIALTLAAEPERLFFINEQDAERLSSSCTVSFLLDATALCSKYRETLDTNAALQTVLPAFASEIKKLRGR